MTSDANTAADKAAPYGAKLPTLPEDRRNVPIILPSSFEELIKFADFLCDSTMIPKDFQGKPANVALAMQWGIEIGLSPVQSLTSIAVINGRPGVFGDAAKALIEANPLCEYIEEWFERDSAGNILAGICKTKRRNRPLPVETRFSWEDAKKAKLLGKTGPWTEYPSRMLQMRARSWTLRDAYPDILRGIGIVEELRDIDAEYTVITETTATAPAQSAGPVTMPKALDAPRIDPIVNAQVATAAPEDAREAVQAVRAKAQPEDDTPFEGSTQAAAQSQEDAPAPTTPLTDGQNRVLDTTLQRSGLTRVDVRTKFGNVHSRNINDVLRWIPERAKELAGDGGDQ